MPDIRSMRKDMNIFQRFWFKVQRFFSDTINELKKVSWPTRKEAINLTEIVIVVIFMMALVLGGLDWVYTKFFGLLLGG